MVIGDGQKMPQLSFNQVLILSKNGVLSMELMLKKQ
jgi:hypothetical protein